MNETSVRGLRAGVKRQTRRLVREAAKTKPLYRIGETLYVKEAWWRGHWTEEHHYNDETGASRCSLTTVWARSPIDVDPDEPSIAYCADGPHPDNFCDGWEKVSPLFMPQWAARFHIKIADVKRQQLHDITEQDARDEGVEALDGTLVDADICAKAKLIGCSFEDSLAWFAAAWDEIHKDDRTKVWLSVGDPGYMLDKPWKIVRDDSTLWAANPLVDAYTFEVTKL